MAERNWRRESGNGAESSRMLKFHQFAAKVRTTASQAAAAGACPTMTSQRTPLNFVFLKAPSARSRQKRLLPLAAPT